MQISCKLHNRWSNDFFFLEKWYAFPFLKHLFAHACFGSSLVLFLNFCYYFIYLYCSCEANYKYLAVKLYLAQHHAFIKAPDLFFKLLLSKCSLFFRLLSLLFLLLFLIVWLWFSFLKGMEELHKTSIGCHGNLKSTNVLVDSYWICKVADHGLHSFRENKLITEERLQCQSGTLICFLTSLKWQPSPPLNPWGREGERRLNFRELDCRPVTSH